MQNEPNFGKAQMNVNKVLTKDYEEKCGKDLWKNEPKTNPIQTQTKPISSKAQNECKLTYNKGLQKKRRIIPARGLKPYIRD